MLDSLSSSSLPHEMASATVLWPDDGRDGLRWVEEPRKSAPGLDSLLIWAFRAGAHRVAFQTGHPVWVGIHGRNHRATRSPIDEIDFSYIVNHLYGADGMARLQGGNDFDTAYAIPIDRSTRLRFRLNANSDADLPARRRQYRAAPDRGHAAAAREPARRTGHPRRVSSATGDGHRQRRDRLRQIDV